MRVAGAVVAAVLLAQPFRTAHANLIDFDGLADLEVVTTQFPGLSFTNATVLTSGISLNEFEFPPRSGANVIFDDFGAITIDVASPVTEVSGFFTYFVPLTLTAFDGNGNSVGTATSAFSANLALSGDPGSSPNELLSVAFAGGISRVTIEADPFGGSFTADDLSFASVAVPEPSTLLLFLSGFAGVLVMRRRAGQTRI